MRVAAAGVGPCDASVREGKRLISQALPPTPGADLTGIVEQVGPGSTLQPGDEVFGGTNDRFTGAYAEYAEASERMMARKPASLMFTATASVPVVGCTA